MSLQSELPRSRVQFSEGPTLFQCSFSTSFILLPLVVSSVYCYGLQVSAVKALLGEAKQGLRRVETEIMVATGVEATPSAPAAVGGDPAADAAMNQNFSQLMSAFHESAATALHDAEVGSIRG